MAQWYLQGFGQGLLEDGESRGGVYGLRALKLGQDVSDLLKSLLLRLRYLVFVNEVAFQKYAGPRGEDAPAAAIRRSDSMQAEILDEAQHRAGGFRLRPHLSGAALGKLALRFSGLRGHLKL